MSTLALQSKVQRHRFAHHTLSALAARLPQPLRSLIVLSSPRVAVRPAAAELAMQQAQEVREMARAYQRSDPGFAADLYAAAARHEGAAAE